MWSVNDTDYTLSDLRGTLPGHGFDGTNILIHIPVNNTEYICVSQTNDGKTRSDPAYIVIAGEYICIHSIYMNMLFLQRWRKFLKFMGNLIVAIKLVWPPYLYIKSSSVCYRSVTDLLSLLHACYRVVCDRPTYVHM